MVRVRFVIWVKRGSRVVDRSPAVLNGSTTRSVRLRRSVMSFSRTAMLTRVRAAFQPCSTVIAAVYAGKNTALSKGVVRESSRAIGNFRDIIEAAHAYGASDVHFEPRDFQGEVEVRFRVNGDLYTFRHMPKAIVRRARWTGYYI